MTAAPYERAAFCSPLFEFLLSVRFDEKIRSVRPRCRPPPTAGPVDLPLRFFCSLPLSVRFLPLLSSVSFFLVERMRTWIVEAVLLVGISIGRARGSNS